MRSVNEQIENELRDSMRSAIEGKAPTQVRIEVAGSRLQVGITGERMLMEMWGIPSIGAVGTMVEDGIFGPGQGPLHAGIMEIADIIAS